MSDSLTFDLVAIGSGPGGYVAAIRGAQLGLKSAVVESRNLGGRCLNDACIPAKAVLRVADFWDEVTNAAQLGVELSDPKLDWPAVATRRDRVIRTIGGGVRALLKKNGVEVFNGHGSLTAGAGVKVAGEGGEQVLAAGKVVLATGSVPLPIPGTKFGGRVLDTAGTWLGETRPERLAVVGAGASGTEIASAFGRFGTRVTLIEMLDRILPAEDEEVSAHVDRELRKQGVGVDTGVRIDAVKDLGNAVEIAWAGKTEQFDRLCIAAGRGADVEGLGLDEVGVNVGPDGKIEVDGRMRTSRAGIYAIGDLVRGPALAHKASEEGVIAAEDAAGLETAAIDYDQIPRVTFCYPQVASMGLTESQARERLGDADRVKVGRFPFGGVGAATVYGDRGGFIKLIADGGTGELLGAHIVGARAAELIAELAVARQAEDTYESLARTIHAHPTLSEGVMEAARDLAGWAIHG